MGKKHLIAAEAEGDQRSLWGEAWRRFKKNRLAMIGMYFILALVIIIVIAVLIAYLVVRRSSALNNTIDTLSMLPYIMPGAVIGLALLIAFGKKPFALTGTKTDDLGINQKRWKAVTLWNLAWFLFGNKFFTEFYKFLVNLIGEILTSCKCCNANRRNRS